jgi:hypothetical protein
VVSAAHRPGEPNHRDKPPPRDKGNLNAHVKLPDAGPSADTAELGSAPTWLPRPR